VTVWQRSPGRANTRDGVYWIGTADRPELIGVSFEPCPETTRPLDRVEAIVDALNQFDDASPGVCPDCGGNGQYIDFDAGEVVLCAACQTPAECIHGLGPVSACTICNGRDERDRAVTAERAVTFAAKYPGQCSCCNLPIHVGQILSWDRENPPVHDGCAP
jgi:hypothetical protein